MQSADLLLELDELVTGARESGEAGNWLDAYLLSSAALQVIEDAVAVRNLKVLSTQKRLASGGGPLARRAVSLWWSLREAAHTVGRAFGAGVRADDVVALQYPLVVELATRVLSFDGSVPVTADDPVLATLADVEGLARQLPRPFRRTPCRLPSSFRSFDQRPDDVVALVDLFLQRCERPESVCAVGVRTSGSYLAPFAVAALAARGVGSVALATVRPGAHLGHHARRTIRGFPAGTPFLIFDDPPTTGSALATSVRCLERVAPPEAKVVLALAVANEDGALPTDLDEFERVTLAWRSWAIHGELSEGAIARDLAVHLGPGTKVIDVTARDADPTPRREHVERRYVARLRSARGSVRELEIEARGVGLGYLGDDARLIARLLGDFLPELIGVSHGVMLSRAVDPGGAHAIDASRVAEYLQHRRHVLTTPRDRSASSGVPQSVPVVAAQLLTRVAGENAAFLLGAMIEPVVRRMLTVDSPCVIDGRMTASSWGRSGGRAVKRHYADGAFSSHDLACYDIAYDLASAAVEGGPGYGPELRQAFEERVGEAVDDDRWLVYTLVALWERFRFGLVDDSAYGRLRSAAVLEYLASVYLADLEPVESGPVVALDLDGVLESNVGGFSAPGRLGATCLRALAAHGFRVVVATGRSLAEVRDRVEILRLAGGVAEYGSAIYEYGGAPRTALDPEDLHALDAVRHSVSSDPDFRVNPEYTHSVRLAHRVAAGRLGPDEWSALRQRMDEATTAALTTIPGHNQVDLVVAGVSKATGLTTLLDHLAVESDDRGRRLALAMGDGEPDLGMFELARRAYAPRNGAGSLARHGVTVLPGHNQAGVAQGVTRLLGHHPGDCPACTVRRLSPNSEWLVRLLSVTDGGKSRAIARLARLPVQALASLA